MATDRFGVEELISWVDKDAVRLCPIHKIAFDPDSVHYHGAGRTCPAGGEPLIGVLARWRQHGEPEDSWPEWWEAMG